MFIYNKEGSKIGEIYEKETSLDKPKIVEKVDMMISDRGLELIKEYEGFRAKPYLCPAGVPTIGYGTTRYNDGNRVTLNDSTMTEQIASDILRYQVNTIYGEAVNEYTTIMSEQSHFDALTSFTYNLGVGNLKSSTLLKKHNQGSFDGAANEFLKWVYADGKMLNGLVKRRKEEREMYLS